jgi:hypothetical protein
VTLPAVISALFIQRKQARIRFDIVQNNLSIHGSFRAFCVGITASKSQGLKAFLYSLLEKSALMVLDYIFYARPPRFVDKGSRALPSLYNRAMGKLVKRAELSVLGAIGIVLFSITHFPAILSVLDDATSTDATAYTAAAVTPYVEDTVTAPSPTTVVTTMPIAAATSTSDTSSSTATLPDADTTQSDTRTGASATVR